MAFPPIDKTFVGMQKDFDTRLTLVERRLAISGSSSGGGGGGGSVYVTDWNEATTDGRYWGNAAANQPVPIIAVVDYWVGEVQTLIGNDGGVRIIQTLQRPDTTRSPIYQRTFNRGGNGIWEAWKGLENGSGNGSSLNVTDLNLIVQQGTYYQLSLTNGTLARHYPVVDATGILEVLAANLDTPTSTHVVQRFTLRGDRDNRVFTRAMVGGGTWQEWVELSSNSHYHVYQSSAQSIPASTWTSIGWNQTAYKVGDIAWDGGTRVFTIPQPGVYQITAAIRYVAQTTTVGQRILSLLVNGTDRLEGLAGNSYGNGVSTGATLADSGFYAAGTTIAIQTYQSSGGALNTIGGQQYGRCQIDRIS